jgi:response regulator RpfG family c-di-GMP phosphodiesterase
MPDDSKPPVLLVDDEPEILYSLVGLLRREFQLHTAENAKQALEILQQHPVHVIMTDQRMPEMTGAELLGRARTEYPSAVRILFTGYADIKAVIDAVNSGGLFRYITKPWDPDELIEVLHEAAAAYDASAARHDLARDLRDYVERGDRLADLLRSDEAARSVGQEELAQFAAVGRDLLARLGSDT